MRLQNQKLREANEHVTGTEKQLHESALNVHGCVEQDPSGGSIDFRKMVLSAIWIRRSLISIEGET